MLPIQTGPAFSPNAPGLRQGSASNAQPAGGVAGGYDGQRALAELETRAMAALARQVPVLESARSFAQLNPADFTPERVADRIAGFVNSGINGAKARGASEAELQSLRDRALQGVERGFRDAREILQGLNILTGRVAEAVDRTEQLVQDKLSSGKPPTNGESQGLVGRRFTAVERFQQAEEFSLRLMTRSGKQVSLQFSRSFEWTASTQLQSGSSRMSMAMDVNRMEASGFQFTVQGELTEDEQRAVQNLVRDASRLANDFFNGEVQRALAQVGSLRFDGEQLSSMELNLSRTESYALAQSYAQTQRVGVDGEANAARSGQLLGQLLQDMRDSFRASILEFLDRPQKAAGDLMRNLVAQDARFQAADEDQQARFRENLDRLLDAVQVSGPKSDRLPEQGRA